MLKHIFKALWYELNYHNDNTKLCLHKAINCNCNFLKIMAKTQMVLVYDFWGTTEYLN